MLRWRAFEQAGGNRPKLLIGGLFLGQGSFQKSYSVALSELLRKADGGHVSGHFVVLNARPGPDDAEVEDIFLAVLSERFRAFADASFHAHAFLARGLDIEHLGHLFEPGDLLFTGTPGGVGMAMKPPVFLKAGDKVRVEVDRLGALEAVCTPED